MPGHVTAQHSMAEKLKFVNAVVLRRWVQHRHGLWVLLIFIVMIRVYCVSVHACDRE